VKGVTTARYLDLMVDLLLVRRLPAWTGNMRKRLIKAPKTYVRDGGICHALLGIETINGLLGHPVVGGSWEGFVIENIAGVLPPSAALGYYRTSGGAEIDLIIDFGARGRWAVEIKRGTAPSVSKGFHSACADLKPTRQFVVYGGDEGFPLGSKVEAVPLPELMVKLTRL
jgi:predicted AAA+ superfamily ATPase